MANLISNKHIKKTLYGSFFLKPLFGLFKYFKKTDNNKTIFVVLVLFYVTLWIINPINKMVLLGFILLTSFFVIKMKSLSLGLLLTLLSSQVVLTGKTFAFDLFPNISSTNPLSGSYMLSLTISPADIIAALMVLALIRDLILGKVKPFQLFTHWLSVIIYLFYLWALISNLFFSPRPEMSLLFDILGLKSLLSYVYLLVYVKGKEADKIVPSIMAVFFAILVFESSVSFIQYISQSSLGNTLEVVQQYYYAGPTPDEPIYLFRPAGTYYHANVLGMNLVHMLILVLITYKATNDKYLLYVFLYGLVSLMITLSRGSWLGFVAAIIIYVLQTKITLKKKVADVKSRSLAMLIVLPITLIVLPRLVTSMDTLRMGGAWIRIEQVKDAWNIVKDHPFFGVGSKMSLPVAYYKNPESTLSRLMINIHNWYLLISVQYGLVGLVLIILFLLLSLKKTMIDLKAHRNKTLNYVRIAFGANLAAFLIMGMFIASPGDNYLLLMLGLLNKNEKDKRFD